MKKIFIENINNITPNKKLINLVKYSDKRMEDISLKAWTFLNDILYENYGITINDEDIIYNENKKPYFKNNKIFFNISHSKELIAIIIDVKECGIDIEYIDYERSIDKIAKKVLSKKEQKKFKYKFNKHKYFFKMWTKKEAYYKFLGIGINYNQLSEDIKYSNIKSIFLKYNNENYYISFSK